MACGLCLPHCPTYRVTGLETASPRGRIAAMQAVELGGAPIDATFERYMEECVQCRGCEAACPSSVPFGHLMEGRPRRAPRTRRPQRRSDAPGRRSGSGTAVVLPRHRLLLALTWMLLLAQRLRLVPRRFGIPRLRTRPLARRVARPGGRPARRLSLPRLRDGRVAARRPPRRAPGDARRRRAARAARAGGRLLRRAARARRPDRRGAPARRAGSSPRCPATRRS